MGTDFFDDPDVKAYLDDAEKEMLPMMEKSALTLCIFPGKVDIKLCVEIGAAILFDKPIIVVVTGDKPVPANLKRVASAIVQCDDMKDEAARAKIDDAISRVLQQDQRAHSKRPVARAEE